MFTRIFHKANRLTQITLVAGVCSFINWWRD